MRRGPWAGALILLSLSALPSEAGVGKPRKTVSRSAVIDPETIAEISKRGDIALVESAPDGSAQQVVIFAVLNAPPEKVYEVIMDVASYPKFLKTVASTKILRREAGMFSYRWELDIPFVTLRGQRLQRGEKPRVVEARGVEGNFRGSRERWELYPLADGNKTLAAFYRSLDLETGGMLVKAIIDLEPSMEHGITLATGFVHMRGLKRYVDGLPRPDPKGRTGPVPPFRTLRFGEEGFDLATLRPLLDLGLLAVIESNEDGTLKQAALITAVHASKEKMASIVQAPNRYPEFIPNFVRNDIAKKVGRKLELSWELKVPVFPNLEGSSELTLGEDGGTEVIATGGDITRGRWRWDLVEDGPGRVIPIHYAYTDVREASMLTKLLVDKEPLMEHGIVIATAAVAAEALKARAEGRR